MREKSPGRVFNEKVAQIDQTWETLKAQLEGQEPFEPWVAFWDECDKINELVQAGEAPTYGIGSILEESAQFMIKGIVGEAERGNFTPFITAIEHPSFFIKGFACEHFLAVWQKNKELAKAAILKLGHHPDSDVRHSIVEELLLTVVGVGMVSLGRVGRISDEDYEGLATVMADIFASHISALKVRPPKNSSQS